MKKAITISIPEPCHEDWRKMSPTEKGKFCKVCTKEVFDFTKATDEELIKKLDAGKNLCGRFKTSQLDREVKLERKKGNGLLPYAASLLVPMGLLGASEGYAQGGPILAEDEYKSLHIESNPVKSIVTITGFVTDAHNIPLNNAEVFILETGQSVRTAPDGSYKLVCTSGSTIYSQKEGITSQHVLLGTKDIQVDMKIEPEIKIVTVVAGMIRTTPVIVEQEAPETAINDIDEETIEGEIEIEAENNAEITISGTVTDEQNIPLPGVNIIVKGAQTATQTDFNGNYEISLLPNSTLVFSYLGYENREIATSNISNTVDLHLFPNYEVLGEVVFYHSDKTQSRRLARHEKAENRKISRAEKKATRLKAKSKTKNVENNGLCRGVKIQNNKK